MSTLSSVKLLLRRITSVRFRTWLFVFFMLPVIGVVLLNGYFLTSFGTGMIEKKISERLRVECRIEGVNWWPWSGITISGLRLLAPEGCGQDGGLLEVDEIVVDPSWSSIFAGKKRWESMEIQGVRIDLSLEALRAVIAKFEVTTLPEVEVSKVEDQVVEGSGQAVQQPAEEGKSEVKTSGKEEESKRDQSVEKKSEPEDDFEGRVVFSDVSIRLYSLRQPELAVEASGLSGEVPLWGVEREGEVKLERLDFGGRLREESLEWMVGWRDGNVLLAPTLKKIFGIEMKISGAVRITSGFPFGFQVELPEQDSDLSPIFMYRASPLEIVGLKSRNVLRGYLLSPTGFVGTSRTSFNRMVFNDLTNGGDTTFERGNARLKLSAAGIVAEEVRAIGDDDAILMNGFMTFGGAAAATVRIVSSPEQAGAHENRVKLGGEGLTLAFEELVTPDRRYRDLRIEAREGGLMVDLAEGREWVPFFPVVGAVLGKRNIEISTAK